MNEEAASRKKIKTCNEEAFILKLEKGNNLRIFFSSTGFEGVKQIIIKSSTKSSLFINGLQTQKFILETIPIIQVWALQNKATIYISDQELKKVLAK